MRSRFSSAMPMPVSETVRRGCPSSHASDPHVQASALLVVADGVAYEIAQHLAQPLVAAHDGNVRLDFLFQRYPALVDIGREDIQRLLGQLGEIHLVRGELVVVDFVVIDDAGDELGETVALPDQRLRRRLRLLLVESAARNQLRIAAYGGERSIHFMGHVGDKIVFGTLRLFDEVLFLRKLAELFAHLAVALVEHVHDGLQFGITGGQFEVEGCVLRQPAHRADDVLRPEIGEQQADEEIEQQKPADRRKRVAENLPFGGSGNGDPDEIVLPVRGGKAAAVINHILAERGAAAHGISFPLGQGQAHFLPVRMVAEVLLAAVRQHVPLRVDKGDPKPGKLPGKAVRARLVQRIVVFVEQVHINFQVAARGVDEIVVEHLRRQKRIDEQHHRHDELGNPQYFFAHRASLPFPLNYAKKRIDATLPYPFAFRL